MYKVLACFRPAGPALMPNITHIALLFAPLIAMNPYVTCSASTSSFLVNLSHPFPVVHSRSLPMPMPYSTIFSLHLPTEDSGLVYL